MSNYDHGNVRFLNAFTFNSSRLNLLTVDDAPQGALSAHDAIPDLSRSRDSHA